MLTDFLRGGISAASYWDQWRRSQNWQGGYDPWRSGGSSNYRDDDDDDDDRKRQKNGGGSSGGFQWPDTSFWRWLAEQ
jgi:hypothetical protein